MQTKSGPDIGPRAIVPCDCQCSGTVVAMPELATPVDCIEFAR